MPFSRILILTFLFTLPVLPVRAQSYELPENLLRSSLEGLRAKMKAVAEKNDQLEKRNHELRQHILDLSREVRDAGEKKISNTEEMIKIETGPDPDSVPDRALLSGRKESLARENRDLQKELEHRRRELSAAEARIADLEQAVAGIKKSAGLDTDPARRKEKDALQTALAGQRSRLNTILDGISGIEEEAGRRRLARQKEEERRTVLRQRRDRLLQGLRRREKEIAFLQEQQEQSGRRRQQAVERVNEVISGYEEARAQLSKTAADLRQAVAEIKETVPAEEDILRQALTRLREERRLLNELEANRLALEKEKNRLGERDMRGEMLRRDLEALQRREEEFREEQRFQQGRLVELKQREQEMIDRHKNLLSDLARLEETVRKPPESVAEFAGQRQDLEERIEAQKRQNHLLQDEAARLEARGLEAQSALASAGERHRELSQKMEAAAGHLEAVRQEQARMTDRIRHFETDSRLGAGGVQNEIESLMLHKDVLASSLALIKGRYTMQDLDLGEIHSEKEQLREYLQTLKRDREALEKKYSALRIAVDQGRRPSQRPQAASAQVQ